VIGGALSFFYFVSVGRSTMAEWIFCLFEIRYRLNFPCNEYLVLNTWIWRLKFCRRHHDEPIYCFLLIQLDMKEKVKIPNTLEYME
jgi:hypothetical protein